MASLTDCISSSLCYFWYLLVRFSREKMHANNSLWNCKYYFWPVAGLELYLILYSDRGGIS